MIPTSCKLAMLIFKTFLNSVPINYENFFILVDLSMTLVGLANISLCTILEPYGIVSFYKYVF